MTRPLRILFSARHLGYVRHYETLVRDLAGAGHHVRLVVQPLRENDPQRALEALGEIDSIEIVERSGRGDRYVLLEAMRSLSNYLRYLDPEFDNADALKSRAARRVPNVVRRRFESTRGRESRRRRLASTIARRIDRVAPPTSDVLEMIREFEPDVVLVTPLVDLGGDGAEFIKAARMLRVPCAHVVASWDNLTNKGRMPVVPDRVIVWNEVQRDEASRLHGVDPDAVAVTGAQTFDEWFTRRPLRSRDEFLEAIGGVPGRPMLLYLCSSGFIGAGAGHGEHEFIADWARAIRRCEDPLVRTANIVVRPHPQVDTTRLHALADESGVIVFPSDRTIVVGESARQDYVDQLANADVAVGINTSAFIEAVVVGTRVATVLDPRYRPVQEGTIHFRYLRDGGALEAHGSLDEHVDRLTTILAGEPPDIERRKRFLQWFVRPYGLDEPAAPHLFEAVVSLADHKPKGKRPKRWLRPFVRAAGRIISLHPEVREHERRMRPKVPRAQDTSRTKEERRADKNRRRRDKLVVRE